MDFVVTKEELCQMLKISARTLVKLRKEKDFPQPFSLTGHENSRDLWIIDDIKAWVRERSKQNFKANA